MNGFSWDRLMAMLVKEFTQMRRDRLTFGMMIGIPLMQLVLFGFAINTDPKSLPTAIRAADNSVYARSLTAALVNSEYFAIVAEAESEAEIDRLMATGHVQFAVTIPQNFARDILRGEPPTLLVEADASDPVATGNAIAALNQLPISGLRHDLKGATGNLAAGPPPFELVIHRRYNPETITQYNIVPGLMGVVLTMTMVMITGLAVTRERERGTMENLLAMPVRPAEVMIGKILPYVGVGYVQSAVILLAARWVFDVPMLGSLWLLSLALILFMSANLAVGFTFSTIAKNQLQAVQMTFFFFLPSILLSGFMFPFRGMPGWAQVLGEVLPLTHFLRIVRGILLKGSSWTEIAPEAAAMTAFILIATTIALKRYRQTLD